MVVHHTGELQKTRATPSRVRHLTADVLTVLAAAATLVSGAAGLVLENLYPGSPSTAAMFQGYDVVNVLVAVALVVLISVRRSSQPVVLARASLLAYLAYNFAYYLFGTGFNDLFLLHVVVFSAALAGLAATALQVEQDRVGPTSTTSARRVAAAVLAVLATALGGMWVYFAIHNAMTGEVPPGSRLVETDTVVHLGMALDLAFLVPWYATAAVLLWRGRPSGYAAAVIALAAGMLHQVSYVIALPVQVAADIPGAAALDPGEPVIVLLYGVGLAVLLTGRPRRDERAVS